MTNEAAAAVLRAIDLPTFVPVLARVGGVVTFFPLLGAETIPVKFRLFLAAALAWLMRPFVPAAVAAIDPSAGAGVFAARIAQELLVGAALGFSAQVAMAGFEAAGQFVGFQMGLTLSGVVDPINGEQVSALSVFYRLVATVIYFSLNAHHVFLVAVRDSYEWVAPGAAVPAAGFAALATRISSSLFLLGLRIAAPALVISLVLDVALLLAARALPQVNLLILGYPVKLALGFLGVAAGLVVLPRLASDSLLTALDQARSLAGALGVAP